MNGITKRNQNTMMIDVICKTKEEQDTKDKCQAFIDDMPHCRNLLLTGNTGTGKTMMASAIINELDKKFYIGAIRTINQISMQMDKARDFSTSLQATDVLKSLIDVDVLVIDEVGMQKGNQTEFLLLDEIIDGRYGEMKPTILISNLNGKMVGELMGDRAVSRLKSNLTQVVFADGDKRL